MTRYEFSRKVVRLLGEMTQAGENYMIDFVKRSDEEQKRLFEADLSKCDGIKKISLHQRGKAMDILGLKDVKRWHNRWVEMDGKPMIEWDQNHFE